MAQKRSKLWEFYSINTPKDAKCNICSTLISRGGSEASKFTTTNLRNHMRSVHPKQLKELETLEHTEQENKKIRTDTLTQRAETSTTSEAKRVHQMTIAQTIDRVSTWGRNDSRTLAINKTLAEMVALDMEPFSIVENVGFIRFCKALESRYDLPHRTHLSRTLIPHIYEKVKTKVKNELNSANALSVTTDIWSASVGSTSLMSLTGHWIDQNFDRKHCVLNASSFEGSHTGDAICAEIHRMLKEWTIPGKNIFAIIRDNASNAVSGCEKTGYPHIGCFIHTLQLVIKDGISTQRSVNDMFALARKIAGHFSHSPLAYHHLRILQAKHGLKEHKIVQDVATRWNSSFYMLKRIVEQKAALAEYGSEHDIPVLTANQWSLAQTLIITLERFEELTRESSCADSTIAMIIPAVRVLDRVLAKHGDHDKGIQTMTDAMHASLIRRFKDIEMNKMLVISTFLDPRYKGYYLFKEENTVENLNAWLSEETTANEPKLPNQDEEIQENVMSGTQAESAEIAILTQPSEPTPQREKKRVSIFDEDFSELMTEKGAIAQNMDRLTLSDEVSLYMSEPVLPRHQDPLAWWGFHKIRFPILSLIARKFLCAPPSSVASERLFSEAGEIYDAKRCHLDPDRAEMLLVIRGNLPLLKFDY